MKFYDTFKMLCDQRGTTPTAVGRELGVMQQTVSHWNTRGNIPNAKTLKRIADYFNVSVGTLMDGVHGGFYERLEKACFSRGMTVVQLRKTLGISEQTVSNWRARGVNPRDGVVYRIADYLGIPVEQLYDEYDEIFPLSLPELQYMARDCEPVWCADADGAYAGILQLARFDTDEHEEVYVWVPETDPHYPKGCNAYRVQTLLREGTEFYRTKPCRKAEVNDERTALAR